MEKSVRGIQFGYMNLPLMEGGVEKHWWVYPRWIHTTNLRNMIRLTGQIMQ